VPIGGGVVSGDARYIASHERDRELLVRGPSDLDLDDTVLQVLDVRGEVPVIRVIAPADQVDVAAGSAVLLVPESALGDRNSDGDTNDGFVHLWTSDGGLEDLEREAVAVAMSSELIAALVPKGPSGETFVEVYDRSSPVPGWAPVGPEASVVDVAARVVAFISVSNRELHIADRRDAGASQIISTGQPAEEFVLGERIVAFRTSENRAQTDLNDDLDQDNNVLQVYDLVSGRLFNTGQAVIPCRFEGCDPRIPYRVTGDTVTFLTLEADQGGQDLDGNGDADGIVVQTFNVRQAAQMVAAAGSSANASTFSSTDSALPRDVAEACVRPLAAVSSGICTDTAEACSSSSDCPVGSCFLPPGGCIEDLGIACDPEPELVPVPELCDAGQFCLPSLGLPGEGTCHVDRGTCGSNADCEAPAVCQDGAQDLLRLFGPFAAWENGTQVFLSAAMSSDASGPPCMSDAECSLGEICSGAGTCQIDREDLIIAGASDSDGDGVADPYDNCTAVPNIDQADLDGDGIGDLCDLMTCGNGVREFSEECDDGNLEARDGCSPTCQLELDGDSDGVPDVADECPDSFLDPTVVVDGCDSEVTNHLSTDGCTISDSIAECGANAKNHGAFRRCVSELGDALVKEGVITPPEKDRILSCAAQADIP